MSEKNNPPRFVLDSHALIAYLEDEAGAERVSAILHQAEKDRAQVWLGLVNYGEVVYITEREKGMVTAQSVIATIDQLPITVVPADRPLTFAAAHIKANYALSYADAFALALAQMLDARLVTGDPEFKKAEQLATIEWLA